MTGKIEARLLAPDERRVALAHLSRDPLQNLFLLDLTDRLGLPPPPGEMAAEVACAWREGELVGVAGLRPSVIFDGGASPDVVAAFLPYLDSMGVGLVKSGEPIVTELWEGLRRRRRRRAVVDRLETGYALAADRPPGRAHGSIGSARAARPEDRERLVIAARESLREENRPDPFAGDVQGFRRWVRGRLGRARVVEAEGEIVFVGYADVQRPEGWLIQGVYTWPRARRRGFATAGMLDLCREAFEAGAGHVQLAVVDGNTAGLRLYEGLGFEPFVRLRTVLFA